MVRIAVRSSIEISLQLTSPAYELLICPPPWRLPGAKPSTAPQRRYPPSRLSRPLTSWASKPGSGAAALVEILGFGGHASPRRCFQSIILRGGGDALINRARQICGPATRQSVRTLYRVRVAHWAILKFLLVPWWRCESRQLDSGDCGGEGAWAFLGFGDRSSLEFGVDGVMPHAAWLARRGGGYAGRSPLINQLCASHVRA